jgi:hypothetical protein
VRPVVGRGILRWTLVAPHALAIVVARGAVTGYRRTLGSMDRSREREPDGEAAAGSISRDQEVADRWPRSASAVPARPVL